MGARTSADGHNKLPTLVRLPQLVERLLRKSPPADLAPERLEAIRWIVTSHGGSVRVESEPDAGATFIVELPLRPPPVA